MQAAVPMAAFAFTLTVEFILVASQLYPLCHAL
jgi:hypothetical protein